MARTIGSVEVFVSADTRRLTAQLRRGGEVAGRAAKDAIDDQLADIGGRRLTQRLAQVRGKIEAALEDLDVDIGADVDTTEVRAAIAEIEATVAAADADVEVGADVDTSEVAATLAKVEAATSAGGSAAGTKAADAFSKSFLGAFGRFGAVAGGVIANSVQPAAVALEGVLGGSVAVVSSAMSGLIGLVGSLPPVGAGVLTSVAALRVGLDDVADALDGNAEALAGLTPAAREFVEAFDGLRPAFDDVRDVVQGRLFAGLGTELERLAEDLLPAVEGGLGDAADSLNTFLRDLADVAADVDLTAVFEAVQPVVDSLLDAVVSVARTVEPFLLAAAPAAQQLADGLAAGADALADMVGANTAAITDFLTEGIDSLGAWAGLAGSIGDALITLFGAGRDAGDAFVSSLAGVIDRFDTWMEGVGGQRALADFFADATEIVGDFAPLVEGLIGLFDRIVTDDAIDRFGQITDIIGDLLPVLGTMFEILGDVAGPVLDILEPVVDGIALLAGAWESLEDPVHDAVVVIATGTVALVALKAIVGPVVDRLDDLIGAFDRVVDVGGDAFGVIERIVDLLPGVGRVSDQVAVSGRGVAKAFGEMGTKLDKTVAAEEAYVDAMEADKKAMREVAKAQRERSAATKQSAEEIAEEREQVERLVEQISDWLTEVTKASGAMADLAGTFDQIGIRQDTLSALFDLGNAPLDAAASVRNIEIAIDDLSETAEGVNVGDILAGNVAADDVLDAIDAMRPQIQTQITDAFSAGGAEAAVAMAEQYISQVATELGISDIDAAKLLGLENITATIDVAIEMSEIEQARKQLEILTGLNGETPFTASIALALDAGTITGEQAQALVQPKLAEAGVTIPTDLAVPTDPGVVAAATAALAGQSVPITTTMEIDPATAAMISDPAKLAELAEGIPTVTVTTTMDTTGFDTSAGEVKTVIEALDASTTEVDITIPFIDTNIARVEGLQTAIDDLTDKTVTITVNTRGGLPAGFDLPNLPGLPGGMAGELIAFPTVRRVGERGYREAIVPLDLPLTRVDPTVRALAAMLRGGDGGAVGTGTTIHRQINLSQTITPRSADPGAVAQQVVNRAAALANR